MQGDAQLQRGGGFQSGKKVWPPPALAWRARRRLAVAARASGSSPPAAAADRPRRKRLNHRSLCFAPDKYHQHDAHQGKKRCYQFHRHPAPHRHGFNRPSRTRYAEHVGANLRSQVIDSSLWRNKSASALARGTIGKPSIRPNVLRWAATPLRRKPSSQPSQDRIPPCCQGSVRTCGGQTISMLV